MLSFWRGTSLAADGSHKPGENHAPSHGGVVTTTKQMDYEWVAKPGAIHLYLKDHGKAADVSRASAKVTLLTGAPTSKKSS